MAGGELSERGKCESSEKSPYDFNIFLKTRYKQHETKSAPHASARCHSLSSTAPKPTNRKIRKKKKKQKAEGRHTESRHSRHKDTEAMHSERQTHKSKELIQANTQKPGTQTDRQA